MKKRDMFHVRFVTRGGIAASLSLMLIVFMMGCETSRSLWRSDVVCPGSFSELMGDLPGDIYDSYAMDISADGERVVGISWADDPNVDGDGNSYYVGGPYPHAWQAVGWTRTCKPKPFFSTPASKLFPPAGGGGLIGLGYLLPSRHPESVAYGISPNGQTVVGWSYSPDDNLAEAVIFGPWSKVRLGKLQGHKISVAYDASDSYVGKLNPVETWGPGILLKAILKPRIIVGYSNAADDYPKRSVGAEAVYWGPVHNILHKLPVPSTLPNGSAVKSSEAVCVSGNGTVLAGNLYYGDVDPALSSMKCVPCVWRLKPSGRYEYTLLSDLPGGNDDARVMGISGDGVVVVGYGNDENGIRACRWGFQILPGTPASVGWGPAENLGVLGNMEYSDALGTNANGSVIVGVSGKYDPVTYKFEMRPVLWTRSGFTNLPPKDIVTILRSNGVTKNLDDTWQYMAKCVSQDGNRIAGAVYRPDPNSTDPDEYIEEGWVVGLQ